MATYTEDVTPEEQARRIRDMAKQ